MRFLCTLTMGLLALSAVQLHAADKDDLVKRYNRTVDLKNYPQDTPEKALASFVQAVEKKEVEYLLAQLAEPTFIDQRVKDYGGKFDTLVQEAKSKLDDPAVLKLLQRFVKEGDWKTADSKATVSLKDVGDRQVLLVKEQGRWFVEHRYQPEKPKVKDPDDK